jgi:hypothetical protein
VNHAGRAAEAKQRETKVSGTLNKVPDTIYPSELATPLAAALSTATGVPVIAFYEYDQFAWGFALFDKGHAVDWFCNRPEVVEHDAYSCTVNPSDIAVLFGVDVEAVAPYLKHLDPDADEPGKAFPADEFSLWRSLGTL